MCTQTEGKSEGASPLRSFTQDLADGSKTFFVLLLVYMMAMAAQPPCPAGSVGWRRRLSSLMVLRSSSLVCVRMECCFVSMRGQPGEAGPDRLYH
jgi:hypothetical protein